MTSEPICKACDDTGRAGHRPGGDRVRAPGGGPGAGLEEALKGVVKNSGIAWHEGYIDLEN